MHEAVKLYLKDDDEAAIGIGTLIIFIALVLVAAIAAAVIIKTAYALKDQAESTGQGAINEVSGSFKVISLVGERTGAPLSADINTLWLYITIWDGSRGIDMSHTRIICRSSTNLNELSLDTTGATATKYDADEVPTNTPGNGWDPPTGMFFLDADNVLKCEIDINLVQGGTGLAPNTGMTLQLVPGSGPVVTEFFVTPPSYAGDKYIDLTNA
jgi:flagellin FlaB